MRDVLISEASLFWDVPNVDEFVERCIVHDVICGECVCGNTVTRWMMMTETSGGLAAAEEGWETQGPEEVEGE